MSVSMGIFYHEYRDRGEPFGLETLHFRQLCEMGQVRRMSVVVFTPEGVDQELRRVQGYTPDADGRWISSTLPVPDVVYLRGVTMDSASDQRMAAAVTWLGTQRTRLINSVELIRALGDKWLTHQLLASDPMISAYLPKTSPLNEAALAEMLNRYPVIMVKHRFGFESRGMIRIERLPERGYACVINDLDASRQRLTVPSFSALVTLLALRAQPAGDYIVQEGIKLASLEGRPFELRMIMNKAAGRWLRTGMVVRLSGTADMPFLAVGSERNQRPSEILPVVFGDRAGLILDQVRALARTIVVELERGAGLGGELALDFGFDQQGHPWLIEGNSKPFNLFIRTGAYSLRRKNMARVLEYAQELAASTT
ncbi:MAG: YheC/YheD family protein [Bacillota bacterium]